MTDGGRGLCKALRERFGKKVEHQRCVIHKSRNLQRHLAKRYRNEAYQRLTTTLEQPHYAEARQMLLELEAWMRTKNESAADVGGHTAPWLTRAPSNTGRNNQSRWLDFRGALQAARDNHGSRSRNFNERIDNLPAGRPSGLRWAYCLPAFMVSAPLRPLSN